MAKSRNRPAREPRKQAASRKSRKEATEAKRTRHDPLYGEIPLKPVPYTGPDGSGRFYFRYDLDYRPPLPKGAVRGNPYEQEFCLFHNVPKYFYVDQERICVQCGHGFLFSAQEQKFWYESLKFNHSSIAIRCAACRRRRRTGRALRGQIAAARGGLLERPKDPALLLTLAESLARYHQRTGKGDLDHAIAAARKARKLWPESQEALFWEGLCQALAGREGRAAEALEAFVASTGKSRRLRPLVREAETLLPELRPQEMPRPEKMTRADDELGGEKHRVPGLVSSLRPDSSLEV